MATDVAGGRGVLYTGTTTRTASTMRTSSSSRCPSGPRKVLVRGAYYGRYLPSGHLIYVHDATLFAAPFDLDRAGGDGPAVRALDGVTVSPPVGAAQIAVSRYRHAGLSAGPRVTLDAPIDWVGSQRTVTPLRATPADWLAPRLHARWPEARHDHL